MIKKAVVFALLLSAGFFALWLATGGESLARPSGSQVARSTPSQPRADEGFVVPNRAGDHGIGSEVTAVFRGGIEELSKQREVPLADGSSWIVNVYSLRAAECRPLAGGRQELIDVEVVFNRIEVEPPKVLPEAKLNARRAVVEVGTDERGRRSIATDKDIELEDAVLTTGDDSRLKNLRLEIDRALLRATDRVLSLRTATDQQPFSMVIDDRGSFSLQGRGLVARLPIEQDGAHPDPTDRISVQVLHEPVLVRRGPDGSTRLEAGGPLRYAENPSTGMATVDAAGGVRLRGDLPASSRGQRHGRASTFDARGERLTATLRRSSSGRDGARPAGEGSRLAAAQWHRLQLSAAANARAVLEVAGFEIECDALEVEPELGGAPCLFTASGRPEITQRAEAGPLRFTAADRVHVVLLQEHWRSWLGSRGFVPAAFPAQLRMLLIFRGSSRVEVSGEDALSVEAEGGMWVLRGNAPESPVATVRGHGAVRVQSQHGDDGIAVRGSDGFLLHRDERGQTVILGPKEADPRHRFAVETAELAVAGSGSCRLYQPLDRRAAGWLELRSPAGDVTLTLPGGKGSLDGVQSLRAEFDDAGARSVDARGSPCEFQFRDAELAVRGTASTVRRLGPTGYRLLGSPAVVVSERAGRLQATEIDLHQLGPRHSLLAARGGARLEARRAAAAPAGARSAAGANLDVDLDLDADSIVIAPFLLPAPALALHAAWLPASALPGILDLGGQHLIARGAVAVSLRGEAEPDSTASGDHLVLRLDGERARGWLRGRPARLVRRDPAGQETRGEASAIALRREQGGERVELLPGEGVWPLLVVANRAGALHGLGSDAGSTAIRCRGRIAATPEAIDFLGEVDTYGLTAAGAPDPQGLQLHAQGMHLRRDAATGAVRGIRAEGSCALALRAIEVTADALEMDLLRQSCRAEATAPGHVVVRLPGASPMRCACIEFDYRTYEATIWSGAYAAEPSGS